MCRAGPELLSLLETLRTEEGRICVPHSSDPDHQYSRDAPDRVISHLLKSVFFVSLIIDEDYIRDSRFSHSNQQFIMEACLQHGIKT